MGRVIEHRRFVFRTILYNGYGCISECDCDYLRLSSMRKLGMTVACSLASGLKTANESLMRGRVIGKGTIEELNGNTKNGRKVRNISGMLASVRTAGRAVR